MNKSDIMSKYDKSLEKHTHYQFALTISIISYFILSFLLLFLKISLSNRRIREHIIQRVSQF
jgi:hypothetical protein